MDGDEGAPSEETEDVGRRIRRVVLGDPVSPYQNFGFT